MRKDEALLILARHPERGKVKTRLAAGIGEDAALLVYQEMLRSTLVLAQAQALLGRRVAVWIDPLEQVPLFAERWGKGLPCHPQPPGDLGARLDGVFETAWREGASRAVAIGTDCPALTSAHLDRAFAALSRIPAVLGPARDGGYYLIGLSRRVPGVFEGIPWSTPEVLAKTLEKLDQRGIRPELLETLSDVDVAEDLEKETRA